METSKPTQPIDACCGGGCQTPTSPVVVVPVTPTATGGQLFRVPAMDCAVEEAEIRRALEGFPSIRRLGFQLSARTLAIDAPEADLPRILDAIRKAGFESTPISGDGPDRSSNEQGHGMVSGVARYAAALLLAMAAEAVSYVAGKETTWQWLGMALALAAIGLAGLDTYRKGFAALKVGKLNINALMSVAVTGAFVIGQWPEAAMVMALYAIAELIEARAVDRARNAIQGLLALTPDVAEVKQTDGTWKAVDAKQVTVGAIVRVKPGERIALDGKVTAGSSAIDQSPVTGESIPVDKSTGDPVFAGTINQSGSLEFEVTAAAANTTLARIIHAVEEAQGTRAPTQRFVDRFAAVYTPAVFAIALLVAVVTPLLLGITWLEGAYKALVLLVIACPCALVIATPVTVVSGLSAAARRGILIKGGTYLEEARKLKAVAFDKTGTVTEGKPKLAHWQVLSDTMPAVAIEPIAAALASRSDHPVSRAIAAGLGTSSLEVGDFKALTGRGIEGEVQGGTYILGNHRLIEERKLCSPVLEALLQEHESAGRTVTVLASPSQALALFAVADTIKDSSREAVVALKRMGIAPVMLTGDNQATARTIASQAGIDDARGGLLPEDKLVAIRELKNQYGATGMSGDGINDAPALAESDIGFAMGTAGTDTAVEAADVVVMTDDLRRIATTVMLSRKTHAILWQNIALALGIKAVFFVLAVFGSATMWMAVFADMGASLVVVANGLRMLRANDII